MSSPAGRSSTSRATPRCALARGEALILAEDVERGIQREMVKEGRAS